MKELQTAMKIGIEGITHWTPLQPISANDSLFFKERLLSINEKMKKQDERCE